MKQVVDQAHVTGLGVDLTRAYYNEFDPGKAEWLRVLIRRGLIAPGDVDERSIADVKEANRIKEYRDRRERLVGHLQELRRSMQESVDSIYETSLAALDVLDLIIQRSDREAGKK